MSREFEIIVPPGKGRERLDVFLTHHVQNATRSKVQQAIQEGLVLLDGKVTRASHKVSPGEVIRVTILKPEAPEVVPEDIPLDILYQDEALLVVNKPAGMVTHPAYGNYRGTLVNALSFHCKNQLSGVKQSLGDSIVARPGIVHRLDKDTSGLMVIAKDDSTHAKLAKQFSGRTIVREYWALVWGRFDKPRGVIEAALGRNKSDRKKIAVTAGGKHAVTEYEVLKVFEFLSLVRLKLLTGRTHQIRVHLHHIGHPVFGDPTYGGRRIAWGGLDRRKKERVHDLLKLISRQTLHAKTIGFVHPTTNQHLHFESELPDDFRAVLTAVQK